MAIFNQVVKGGGTTPTGTISITSNGTHDVTNYATADVQVPTTAPAHYIERKVDANGEITSSGVTSIIDLTGVSIIGYGALAYAYRNNATITQVPDFSNITIIRTLGMTAVFERCSNLTGVVNFSNLYLVDNNALEAAFIKTKITAINFPKLTTLNNFNNVTTRMCQSCSYLTSFNFDALEIAEANTFLRMFEYCSALTTGRFPSLKTISAQKVFQFCFASCSSLQSLWFYALTPTSFGSRTNQFNNMLQYCTNVTVHFPMAIQSTIGSWSDVTAGFGGTNTTVLFDLVTSLTGADGNTYTRQEKDSTSTATAWVYNDTLYYTSGVSDNANGVNEPAVSDTIYSDAACTQSVTTITAIA